MAVNSVVDRSVHGSSLLELRRELVGYCERLPETLAAILGSLSRQQLIAERSYWHPNGFLKLVLQGDRGTQQYRLHVWSEVSPPGDVHGHAWCYRSVVLAGALTETRFREAAAGQGQPRWRHAYGGLGQRRFSVAAPALAHVAEVGPAQVHVAGDESGGEPSEIHRFFASAAPAATLLRIGPIVESPSYLYRTAPEEPHLVTPRLATRDDVCNAVAHVAELIEV